MVVSDVAGVPVSGMTVVLVLTVAVLDCTSGMNVVSKMVLTTTLGRVLVVLLAVVVVGGTIEVTGCTVTGTTARDVVDVRDETGADPAEDAPDVESVPT